MVLIVTVRVFGRIEPVSTAARGFKIFWRWPRESTAFMVLQSPELQMLMISHCDPSNFICKWLNDGGANRGVSPDLADFTANYREISLNITVAKQNVCMEAIRIGDCEIHTLDNMGRPFKMILRDVLHVPGASRHIMSASCVAQQGFQSVLPCQNGVFPPGLYCPRTSTTLMKPTQQARYIPFQTVNGLHYVATRSDMLGTDANLRLTRSNQCIVYSRKLGHIPLATLWQTRQCVRGLEFLSESHFPRNYVSSDVMVGKMTHVDIPKSTGTRPSRPNEVWHMDTLGPTQTRSAQGFYYNTTFTCGATGLSLAYGHANTAQVADLQERWYADTARLRELHGDPRVLRCDNASVNVSARATQFRLARNIRTETSCPYESQQMGTAERINRTLTSTARTVLLASGLDKRWWHHAMMYANYTQNIQYLSVTKSSPHLLMYCEKLDVSE